MLSLCVRMLLSFQSSIVIVVVIVVDVAGKALAARRGRTGDGRARRHPGPSADGISRITRLIGGCSLVWYTCM